MGNILEVRSEIRSRYDQNGAHDPKKVLVN